MGALKKRPFVKTTKTQIFSKQKFFNPVETSSDEDEEIPHVLDNSEDEFVISKSMSGGDFVLVKFVSPKTGRPNASHFVGRIIKESGEREFLVTILRRAAETNYFIYPEVENISVSMDDMIKLPNPISAVGTARIALQIYFHFDFSEVLLTIRNYLTFVFFLNKAKWQ